MFHLGLLTRPTSVHPGFVTLEFFSEMYSGLRSFVIWDELHSLRMKEAPVRLYEGLELVCRKKSRVDNLSSTSLFAWWDNQSCLIRKAIHLLEYLIFSVSGTSISWAPAMELGCPKLHLIVILKGISNEQKMCGPSTFLATPVDHSNHHS